MLRIAGSYGNPAVSDFAIADETLMRSDVVPRCEPLYKFPQLKLTVGCRNAPKLDVDIMQSSLTNVSDLQLQRIAGAFYYLNECNPKAGVGLLCWSPVSLG